MSTPTLQELAAQLAQKEGELQQLRNSYDARLGELRKQKEELETSLRQLDTEIAVASGQAPPDVAAPSAAEPGKVTLGSALVSILQTSGKALTVKELVDELVRQKYPTTSNDLPRMVAKRVRLLLEQKTLARAKKGDGVYLAGTKPAAPKAAKSAAPKAAQGDGTKKLTLTAVIGSLLATSPSPMMASELADQLLAAGYKTKSATPINLVYTTLSKMENVEKVPGQGYRLKK